MIDYGMSFDDYQANPAIGSGTAKTFLISPQLTKDALDGNLPSEDRPAYQVGRLAHMMVLEPQRFADLVTTEGPVNPKTGSMYGRGTKAFADWQAEHPELTVVEPFFQKMMDRMPPQVREIFASKTAHAEVSVIRVIAKVHCKARPDWLDGDVIVDLKTIDNVYDAERAIRRHRYWFQAGWYRLVVGAELGRHLSWRFVFAEKNPPYRWRIVELDAEWMMVADDKANEVLAGIATAQRTGDWSDNGEITITASQPSWGEE